MSTLTRRAVARLRALISLRKDYPNAIVPSSLSTPEVSCRFASTKSHPLFASPNRLLSTASHMAPPLRGFPQYSVWSPTSVLQIRPILPTFRPAGQGGISPDRRGSMLFEFAPRNAELGATVPVVLPRPPFVVPGMKRTLPQRFTLP